MIRYYAYYNYGGYKDLFLGTDQDANPSLYYLPLLAIYEESLRTEPDAELEAQVESLRTLPAIVALSDSTPSFNYPKDVRVLMSHGGYKVMLKREGMKTILSVRDIMGTKDSFGRSTPFNFMLVAEEEADFQRLSDAAAFVKGNVDEFESFIKKLFVNDFDVNGLRFDLGVFNAEFFRMVDESGLKLDVDKSTKSVPMLVVPQGIVLKDALAEQQISQRDLFMAFSADGTELFRANEVPEPDRKTCTAPNSVYYGTHHHTNETSQAPDSNSQGMKELSGSKDAKHPHLSSLIEKLGLKDDNSEALKEMLVALAQRVDELEQRIEAMEKENFK